ncbi:MAG: hypothetical protein ACYC9K_11260 [Sulfuricaulis sp.]
MKAASIAALVVAFIAVVVLLMFFGGGAMTGGVSRGGMPGSDGMHGISWMWIPIFLPFGLGLLFGWLIFGIKIMGGNNRAPDDSRCL